MTKKAIIAICVSCVILLVACTNKKSVPNSLQISNENFITGIVVSANENNFAIYSDAVTYTFPYEKSVLESEHGLVLDCHATVYYEGELNPELDMQDITIKRIVAASSTQVVSGEIINVSENFVSIKVDNDSFFSFSAKSFNENISTGTPEIGNEATVYYCGALDKTKDIQQINIVNVVILPAPSHEADTPEIIDDINQISGTITQVTDTSLTIKDSHGNLFVFTFKNALIQNENELVPGNRATVYFTGELSKEESDPQNVDVFWVEATVSSS